MKAVVFNGPFEVKTEERPKPQVEDPLDVILRVKYSGVCGTDLHTYRGHIKLKKGQIIGHEFIGTIVEKGDGVLDKDFKIGDEVLSTFTIQCGECWYCKHGYSGQCEKTNTFGKIGLDGGQAEFVKVPYAVHTLIRKPTTPPLFDDSVYVMMADIFVTGYYGVKKILDFFKNEPIRNVHPLDLSEVKILQIGAGPVGLCAIRVLKHFGFKNIVCVDNVPSRLQSARKMGASSTINFETEAVSMKSLVDNETAGLGFDAVLEAVGAPSALRSAYDNVRGNGFICSIGMAHDVLPFNGLECYLKNVNVSFGRCHSWSLFAEALKIFEEIKEDFFDFIDCKLPLDDSEKAFKLFDQHKVNKVVFDLTK